MYLCLDCNKEFYILKKYIEPHGEEYMGCPKCGSRDIVNSKECEYCHETIKGEYVKIKDDVYYCENCYSTGNIRENN